MTRSETRQTRNNMDKVMRELSLKKEAPKSAFILLVILYIIASVFTVVASRSEGYTTLFDNRVQYASFAASVFAGYEP